MNHRDLPSGRCLYDRFSRKVLLVSSKTTVGGLSAEVIRAEETIGRIKRIVKMHRQYREESFRADEGTTTTIALEVDIHPSSYSANPTNYEYCWIL